jgi:hypothetical protein
MSLRRQSCNNCYAARRKCDLSYPSCDRCTRLGRKCHFKHPPLRHHKHRYSSADTVARAGVNAVAPDWPVHFEDLKLSVPQIDGNLGILEPLKAKIDFQWVFDQVKGIPIRFARQADTMFIHKDLYQDSFPRPLRVAFGICAGCLSLNRLNQAFLFHALDEESIDLLEEVSTSTLREDASILQALLLYQVIRLFHGDRRQQIMAERQEIVLRSRALAILQRAKAELDGAPRTWETWLLAESIRRTVLILFKVYMVYWCVRSGAAIGVDAIRLLPVSLKPGSWDSRDVYSRYPNQDDTIPYGDFTLMWSMDPRNKLENFEKLIMMGYLGESRFEALSMAPQLYMVLGRDKVEEPGKALQS